MEKETRRRAGYHVIHSGKNDVAKTNQTEKAGSKARPRRLEYKEEPSEKGKSNASGGRG